VAILQLESFFEGDHDKAQRDLTRCAVMIDVSVPVALLVYLVVFIVFPSCDKRAHHYKCWVVSYQVYHTVMGLGYNGRVV
jgi:hypothetical protein